MRLAHLQIDIRVLLDAPLLTEERRSGLLSTVIGAKVKEDAVEEAAQGPEQGAEQPEQTRNSVLEQWKNSLKKCSADRNSIIETMEQLINAEQSLSVRRIWAECKGKGVSKRAVIDVLRQFRAFQAEQTEQRGRF